MKVRLMVEVDINAVDNVDLNESEAKELAEHSIFAAEGFFPNIFTCGDNLERERRVKTKVTTIKAL